MNQAEMERRFAEINAREPEEPDEIDLAMLAEAERINDDSTVRWEEFKEDLKRMDKTE